jgi:hypothetical protein
LTVEPLLPGRLGRRSSEAASLTARVDDTVKRATVFNGELACVQVLHGTVYHASYNSLRRKKSFEPI